MAGYCGGKVGCVPSSYGLGLLDLGVAEPWDRGHGYVTMVFNESTVAELRLNATVFGGGRNVSVLYWQGPIADRAYAGNAGLAVGATFTSEIASGHPAYTKGQMLGAPALLMSSHGAGRVLISPPHPEETTPQIYDLVLAYTLWAAQVL
jgi:hypothetical protein